MSETLELRMIGADVNHVEGVAWGPDNRIYAGGEKGELYRVSLADGSCEEYANTGGSLLGLALDGEGNVYACDMNLRQVVKVAPEGTCSTYSTGTADRPMRLPNYPVFDALGNLYVSDSGDWGARNGLIWRIDPAGTAEVWSDAASGFTNGMCLDANGRALYVVESTPPLVSRVEISDDGASGPRTVMVELPHSVPDGLALDQEGNLIISLFNPNIIYRLDANGDLSTMYDDWEQLVLMAPTNTAFAGPDLRTLVIANLFGRDLLVGRMGVPGQPLHYPTL